MVSLEQAKNLKHRQAVAKLRSGNHRLSLNYLNLLGFVNTAALTKLRTKTISYFIVIVIKLLGNKITSDIVLKYPSFNLLNNTD